MPPADRVQNSPQKSTPTKYRVYRLIELELFLEIRSVSAKVHPQAQSLLGDLNYGYIQHQTKSNPYLSKDFSIL